MQCEFECVGLVGLYDEKIQTVKTCYQNDKLVMSLQSCNVDNHHFLSDFKYLEIRIIKVDMKSKFSSLLNSFLFTDFAMHATP